MVKFILVLKKLVKRLAAIEIKRQTVKANKATILRDEIHAREREDIERLQEIFKEDIARAEDTLKRCKGRVTQEATKALTNAAIKRKAAHAAMAALRS